ncbi:hypothetical protein CANCADRAFT_148501 [Tortispora caseinolytica NRRL Y-17796]|uniref:Uncharacterized protein n=1 Tax=Tortispora caseinolytica NRRL Y-17796 TaxID=767744 RepID=A0A1E4TC52_9ASCO|nr:hypothetical protein CANCADRAFT_148501 [Tortispora caseinolytica NRRL Y-17796]
MSDPRFKAAQYDPRFRRPKSKDVKVKVDKRFKDALSSEAFAERKVDKYGRKVKQRKERSNLYEFEDDEDKEKAESEGDDEEEDEKEVYDPARGLGVIGSSSESSSEDSEDESDLELEEDIAIEEGPVLMGDESKRFALVNLDWDNITAQDLMVVLSSFADSKDAIVSVTIYPSEFGKQQMSKERHEGPPSELFTKSSKKEESADKKLRRYQLQRLRYYYAVAEFKSVAAAAKVYNACDGTEYEATANIFDLRYIPDDMVFDDKPKDQCTKLPTKYQPLEFVTDALRNSKVKLSWDETPTARVQFAKKAFSQKEIDDMDFKAYIASDSDSDDESDLAAKGSKLKEALSTIKSQVRQKDDVDMEVSFAPALAAANPSGEDESTIDKYIRKQKEKKQRKEESKAQEIEDKGFDDEFFDDAPAKKSKDKKKTKAKIEYSSEQPSDETQAASKAELELLTMDDSEEKRAHFDMREIVKAEKASKHKKKSKRKAEADERLIQDDFKIDVNDPRFSSLYANHEYAIDPTVNRFKKTKAMSEVLEERKKRNQNQHSLSDL